MLPWYEYFFGNFIFAFIARTFSGNQIDSVVLSFPKPNCKFLGKKAKLLGEVVQTVMNSL